MPCSVAKNMSRRAFKTKSNSGVAGEKKRIIAIKYSMWCQVSPWQSVAKSCIDKMSTCQFRKVRRRLRSRTPTASGSYQQRDSNLLDARIFGLY